MKNILLIYFSHFVPPGITCFSLACPCQLKSRGILPYRSQCKTVSNRLACPNHSNKAHIDGCFLTVPKK